MSICNISESAMKTRVENIIRYFEKNNPNPQIELYYINVFTLLIACILSARATDLSVNKVTHDLFSAIILPIDVINFDMEKFMLQVKSINFYRKKVMYIYQTSQYLIDHYNGNVPNNLEDLRKLPGVGLKTAAVILNIGFHQAIIPVDTHVFRIAKRIGLSDGKTINKVFDDLNNIKYISDEDKIKLHLWMVLHGRYVCKSRKINKTCAICLPIV